MKLNKLLAALIGSAVVPVALAGVYPQCPADVVASGTNATDPDTGLVMRAYTPPGGNRKVCLHLAAGDGWMTLGDGTRMYGFGFSPANPVLAGRDAGDAVMINGLNAAQFSAPKLTFRQGDEVYLALTNVGMVLRPDLFDQHSVHWHGFPEASAIFDGVPNASVTVNQGSTFTYYYKVVEAGTFIYHCHVESTEHMAMGMLGILNVEPSQNALPARRDATQPLTDARTYAKFAYNDGDGSTGYTVDFSLQLGGMDSNFHDLHERVQPLPFLELKTDYTTLNGRGYPMTTIGDKANMQNVVLDDASELPVTQPLSALITARTNERVLLRMSNLNIIDYYTVTALGVPMRVVGRGAHIARGTTGAVGDSWAHNTGSVTLGGGEAVDVLLDLQGVAPGTYYLYTTNLNYLSNGASDDRGGLMTKIVVAN